MNDFDSALKNIEKEYPLRRISTTYAQIEFDILFDDYNYIFIGVLFEDNEVILTDMADYSQLDYWHEENLPEVEKICREYGVRFNNWNIECLYHSNEDIKRYLDCLLAIKDRFVKD